MKALINEVDLFEIYKTARKLSPDNPDFWEKLPKLRCGEFDVHYFYGDDTNFFDIYRCGNVTHFQEYLTYKDFDPEKLDDAYRNSLTCSECACEIAFCTCKPVYTSRNYDINRLIDDRTPQFETELQAFLDKFDYVEMSTQSFTNKI